VAQAAAQQDLDVGLGGGAVRVVVGVGPLGAVGAALAAHERAAEEGGLPGQRVAAVAGAGGVEAAQADVDREVRGGGEQRPVSQAHHPARHQWRPTRRRDCCARARARGL
jgi:hypothetical protein